MKWIEVIGWMIGWKVLDEMNYWMEGIGIGYVECVFFYFFIFFINEVIR